MMRMLYHLARADFLERVRRQGFLLTLVFAAMLAYGAFTGSISLLLGPYRGIYNAAWVGSMMTLVTTTFISLAGFYIVKSTIARDRETGVGLVLATTPMSRSAYTMGKALSNFAVLAAMVAVLAAAAVILQLSRREAGGLELATLLAPFAWVALPAMAMTAALAVLFESLPVLRGGAGNVIYFFAWGTYLGLSAATGANDYLGLGFFTRRMTGALKAVDPSYGGDFELQAGPTLHASRTFVWDGVTWTPHLVAFRLVWVGVAIGIAWASALCFHRFDPAREGRRHRTSDRGPEDASDRATEPIPATPPPRLTPLAAPAMRGGFGNAIRAELRLMLAGRRWWWYLVLAALVVAPVVLPRTGAGPIVAAFAWLWPVLVWSPMGARERAHRTGPLIFSCARVLARQLPALWSAGVITAGVAASGVLIRLVVTGAWAGVAAWFAAVLFIPSLALALGVWTGSSRFFEALYAIWWYLGPMNHTPGLDFTTSAPALYAVAAIALSIAARGGRRREIGYA